MEAVVKILRADKSLYVDFKGALTVERVVPRHRQLVEKSWPRLKAKYLTQTDAGDMASPDLRLYNALEDYKKRRDEENEITTAEKNKEADKKEPLLARSIATGKISRVVNGIPRAVELPESPEVVPDVFLDSERVDDSPLDLVSDDVEVEDGCGGESLHSSGDEDEGAGRCERDGAARASAPTVGRLRFLKRSRSADAMRATKAHKKKCTTAREMVATFQDMAAKSLAAADDGRKARASSMTNGQEAMVSALQNEYEKDRAADSSVIASQAQTRDTMVSALGQLAAAVEKQGGGSDSVARLSSVEKEFSAISASLNEVKEGNKETMAFLAKLAGGRQNVYATTGALVSC
jgi:hypothetical protein